MEMHIMYIYAGSMHIICDVYVSNIVFASVLLTLTGKSLENVGL